MTKTCFFFLFSVSEQMPHRLYKQNSFFKMKLSQVTQTTMHNFKTDAEAGSSIHVKEVRSLTKKKN